MKGGLPTLGVSEITVPARDAAERLLNAFYLQDARETHLLAGRSQRARLATERATEYMSQAFCTEFCDADEGRAKAAGRSFMRALFLQDEIENKVALRARGEEIPSAMLVSDVPVRRDDRIDTDPRWEEVRSLLESSCAHVGVDLEYAEIQSRFWRHHGQRKPDWCRYAFEAHRIKLRAMIPDGDRTDVERLSRYFVEGVQLHDSWSRDDRDRDFADIVGLVSRYYQRIFDLRGEHGRPN